MSRFEIQDHYFTKAKSEGYNARSVFKLAEIDQKFQLLKRRSAVLDLGCAPGSWLQYVAKKIGPKGCALGIDLTPIKEQFHPRIITKSFDCFDLKKESISMMLLERDISFEGFDVVLSDMAPKTTGMKHVDQFRSFELSKKAFLVAKDVLKPGGHVVIKIFASSEAQDLIKEMRNSFSFIKQFRPKSVRAVSKEFYAVGYAKR